MEAGAYGMLGAGRKAGWLALLAGVLPLCGTVMQGQVAGCAVPAKPASDPAATGFDEAATDLREGRSGDAEALYRVGLGKQPGDALLTAGLLRALVMQNKLQEASLAAADVHAGESQSAPLLTADAELAMHEGQPWSARALLDKAVAADPCYARAHLLRSRLDRMDSMYASEREEIEKAYELDPTDPEAQHLWKTVDTPAKDTVGVEEYLATTPMIDPAQRKSSEEFVASMRPQLMETSQNCRGLPTVATATLPLLRSMRDGQHVDAYRLEVQIGQSRAKLVVDTAASGLYISRALASANGLTLGEGDPPGTVRAPDVSVGPVEFHDCLVGVSETPFPDKGDGFVGTDLFSGYLMTLDQPGAKLVLEPLPAEKGPLPMDRSAAVAADPVLRGWEPVYHKAQFLLVPVALNERERRLFVLDTGVRFSTIAPAVANEASPYGRSATSSLPTISGGSIQVYRSGFDFGFGDLLLRRQEHIVAMETASTEQTLHMKIGGLLGFDLLHSMTIHLDYRDGLAKFESTQAEVVPPGGIHVAEGGESPLPPGGSPEESCPPLSAGSLAANTTLQARTTGLWESNHMKPGQNVTVTASVPWSSPECTVPAGGLLYGHVTTAAAPGGGGGQLGLEFDHADCMGKGKRAMDLKIVAVEAPPTPGNALHSALPTAVGGGMTRSLGDAVNALGEVGGDRELTDRRGPKSIQPGSVLGLPKLTLDVSGGQGCSALVKSEDRNFRLGVGTGFLLVELQKP